MSEEQLSEREQDVATLASIASPLPLAVIQATLELSDEDASSLVDDLARRGYVTVDRMGVSTRRSFDGGARESMLASRLLRELDARDAPAELKRKERLAWFESEAMNRVYAMRDELCAEHPGRF